MKAEKRKPRAYKIQDKAYIKAMRRANKEGDSLATLIELWVTLYADKKFTTIQ